MSKINQAGRRFELFDPNNKEHRRLLHEAVQCNTWSRSPIRFWVNDEHADLMTECTKHMARWYLDREFDKLRESK